MNTTTISLIHTDECDIKYEAPVTTQTYIQLLQLSEFNNVKVIQCKIEISRTIYHCGMHSHISIVHNGHANYLHETTRDTCLKMHKEGRFYIGTDGVINQLKPNGTFYHSVTLAGKAGVDGTCQGIIYADHYGSWEDVVVQAHLTISLRTSYVPVNLNRGKIILRSGTICELTDGNCLDSDDGYTFWEPLPNSACNFNKYDVLYEGTATKMQGNLGPHDTTIYSLTTQDITFALTLTRPHIICGYTITGTEHPKLFIFETKRGNVFKTKSQTTVDNLDIFTYINSKFVYVERHIRTQMKALYYDIIQQKCELEKQVLQNTLSLATFQPDEFAFRLMKAPGYMAVAAGEVIHVVKCIPIEVTLRKTNSCYTDLPVNLSNRSYFITPKSRILTRFSTERDCNPFMPIQYYIEHTWIQFNPSPNVVLPPQILKPLTKLKWVYSAPSSLATSGIYSENDLRNLRNHIMFPAERNAVLHTIARGFTGQNIGDNSVSLKHLLDEDTLDRIYTNTATKIWKGFVTFGSATAGVFGIFVIIRIIKIVFDTLIHGYALHSAYGCSLHMIGALWSSITHLLLHLANKPKKTQKETPKNDTETPQESESLNMTQKTATQPQSNIPNVYSYRELQQQMDEIRQISSN